MRVVKGRHGGKKATVVGEAKVMAHVKLPCGKVVQVKKDALKKKNPKEESIITSELDRDVTAALQLLMSSLSRMKIDPKSTKALDIFVSAATQYKP